MAILPCAGASTPAGRARTGEARHRRSRRRSATLAEGKRGNPGGRLSSSATAGRSASSKWMARPFICRAGRPRTRTVPASSRSAASAWWSTTAPNAASPSERRGVRVPVPPSGLALHCQARRPGTRTPTPPRHSGPGPWETARNTQVPDQKEVQSASGAVSTSPDSKAAQFAHVGVSGYPDPTKERSVIALVSASRGPIGGDLFCNRFHVSGSERGAICV